MEGSVHNLINGIYSSAFGVELIGEEMSFRGKYNSVSNKSFKVKST